MLSSLNSGPHTCPVSSPLPAFSLWRGKKSPGLSALPTSGVLGTPKTFVDDDDGWVLQVLVMIRF